MRRVPVAALLVVVTGICFQARGNGSEVSTNSSTGYVTKSGDEKSPGPFGEAGPMADKRPDLPFLVSQVNGIHQAPIARRHHRVMLSWKPGADWIPGEPSLTGNGIVGYNVYRCDGLITKCVRLNTEPVATPDYVDAHVQSGRIYYYATTAVNQSGGQSRPSNIVRVEIPLP